MLRNFAQRLLQTDQNDWSALVARLALGIAILPHGLQKLFGWFGGYGLSGTLDHFTQNMGIPLLLAFLVIMVESVGSFALITGLAGRLNALAIGTTMVVAVFMVHLSNGFFMNWSGVKAGEGFEYHILAVGLAAVTMIRGSGALSLDSWLSDKLASDEPSAQSVSRPEPAAVDTEKLAA